MTGLSQSKIAQSHTRALNQWSAPNKYFTSGFDPRSSDNALLALMSGGLNHAHQNDWLNAGRRLIDKTYVQILFVTQGLSSIPFLNAEHTAAALDDFIRQQIAPIWSLINEGRKHEKKMLADELLKSASCSLFGSLISEAAASHLLFYLCPTLPVVPVVSQQRNSNQTRSSLETLTNHQAYLQALQVPAAHYGTLDDINLVNTILYETDWWQRNVVRIAHSNP